MATQSERTHFLGMVPLAWALQNAGHEVRVASQPELVGTIASTGLMAVSVGTDHLLPFVLKRVRTLERLERLGKGGVGGGGAGFDIAELHPDPTAWERVRSGYTGNVTMWWQVVNEPMVDDLTAFCREWRPDLIVWEPVTYAAAIAAEAVGVPHARILFSLDLVVHMSGTFNRMAAEQPGYSGEPLTEWLAARAAGFGAEIGAQTATGSFTVDYVPGSLKPDCMRSGMGLDYLPVRYVPYGGRAVVPRWLREPPERARVALTLGTSATDRLGGYAVGVQDILDSLADLDIEIVATLPAPEQAKLDRVPANTRLVEYVPLDALMATCSAVINHGGPGTVLTAARHALPQLVVPSLFDAPLLGRRLAAQGAGVCVAPEEATGEAVRSLLVRLLGEPGFAAAARGLRAEMGAMPDPGAAVARIEERVAALR